MLIMRASITWIFSFVLGSLVLPVQAQPLEGYVREGLQNSLVLQQTDISVQQAASALREAKGLFLPKVQLNAAYTSGYGGRSISFPIGDLLNPVYTTLNQMTQSNSFPQVENVNQNFFPQNFYDVKLHTTVPIWNSTIQENRDLRLQMVELQSMDLDTYRRELIRSIRVAYYQYCQSLHGLSIYAAAAKLAAEAERVNQRLLDNGAGLPAYVIRAHSEVEQLEARQAEAGYTSRVAQSYFNFLLNKPLDSPIDTTGSYAFTQLRANAEALEGVENKEELKRLRQAMVVQAQAIELSKSQLMPTLGGFVDVGMQAEQFRVNEDAPYLLFGVQLDVPIFSGFSNTEKIARARLDLERTRLQSESVRQQLELQAVVAANQYLGACRNQTAAQSRLNAAATYQQLIERAFREGKSSFIETVEARQQYLQAAEQLNISHFNVRIADAELAFALAEDALN